MSADVSRRAFLCSLAGCAAAAVGGCGDLTHTEFFRENFRDLSKEELAEILKGLEADNSARFRKDVTMKATPAMPGVEFGYALDIARCIGCRRCVYGCVEENNQSRDPQIHWIRVLQMNKDKGIDFEEADAYYDAEKVPESGHFYLPVACQQCRDAPCVKSCPVGATWQEPDGIVVIDYNWCIGCRCCMAACPYGARHFNWATPGIPETGETFEDQNGDGTWQPEEGFEDANGDGVHDAGLNPNCHYLGNRPRMKGVVEKCTFCIHRVREGRYPRCVEVCPVGARKFGNLLDPASEVRQILERKRVVVLKAELATHPRFYYYFG